MSERRLELGEEFRAFRVWREGNRVYAQVPGYRPTYVCRYTNEKAVAAVLKGWARARGMDV